MLEKVKTMIEMYHLSPLPVENTLFVSTWRSQQEFSDGSPVGTAMIGLYTSDPPSFSRFHKLPVDEVWHFYGGDPLRLILLLPDGSSKEEILGQDLQKGQRVQLVIPAGVWQAGTLVDGGEYCLYGCTMAPGFTGSMFVGGTKSKLLPLYPDRINEISLMACPENETNMPEGFSK